MEEDRNRNRAAGAGGDAGRPGDTDAGAVAESDGPVPEAAAGVEETESEHREPRYLLVWAGLAALTLAEVWFATTGIAKSLIVAGLVGMAIWKALLVALYYMHLRFEPLRVVMVAAFPLPLAVILVMAVLMEF